MATPKKKSVKAKSKPAAKKKLAVKAPAKKAAKVVAKAKPAVSSGKKTEKPALKTSWDKVIQPLQDRIVALEIEQDNTTPSGLILAKQEESFKHARVVAAGVGRKSKKGVLRPLDVQVGDVILVNSYAGTKVTVENQEALIVREEDVLGIVSSPSL